MQYRLSHAILLNTKHYGIISFPLQKTEISCSTGIIWNIIQTDSTTILLLFFKNGQLVGLMPGNANNGALNSHEGLTFGGIISDNDMKISMMVEIFEKLINYCKDEHFTHLMYKTIPYIYHQVPAEEDLYCLFRHKARLIGRCINSSVQMPLNIKYTKERIRTIKKAKNNNIIVKQSSDFETFMNIRRKMYCLNDTVQDLYIDPMR